MLERLLKWFGFSILLTLLPIGLSLLLRIIFELRINLSDYTSELLFMGVTLSATSISDICSLLQKGAKGSHITVLLLFLIFLVVICTALYEMKVISNAIGMPISDYIIDRLTFALCTSNIIISVICQIFLEKIEGDD